LELLGLRGLLPELLDRLELLDLLGLRGLLPELPEIKESPEQRAVKERPVLESPALRDLSAVKASPAVRELPAMLGRRAILVQQEPVSLAQPEFKVIRERLEKPEPERREVPADRATRALLALLALLALA
jgi:hypothetical protein